MNTNDNTKIEMFDTQFESKNTNKFICLITIAGSDESAIPAYVIKSVSRPSCCKKEDGGSWNWDFMHIRFYDPVIPSTTLALFKNFIEKSQLVDINLKVLGTVADVVEHWVIKNAEFVSLDFGTLNWKDGCEYIEIKAIVKISDVTLKF